jgi:hypothetical protein
MSPIQNELKNFTEDKKIIRKKVFSSIVQVDSDFIFPIAPILAIRPERNKRLFNEILHRQ